VSARAPRGSARRQGGEAGETLFGAAARGQGEPLASRMRPRTLDEVVGQQHVLGAGARCARCSSGGAWAR
jgi:putative ATPase